MTEDPIDQNELDRRIYETIRQNERDPLTIRELCELNYFEQRGFSFDLDEIDDDPIPLTGIEIGELIFWAYSQGNIILEEIAEQLGSFLNKGYDAPIPYEEMDMVYHFIINTEMPGVTIQDKLKQTAYLLLVADHVAYEGNMIEL